MYQGLKNKVYNPEVVFICISLTNTIQVTTLASCCLQVIEKLRFASPLSGQVRNTKLFKAFSYAQVLLAIICEPLVGFAASNF